MKILKPGDALIGLRDAVFLAGPATRTNKTLGWREEMIHVLRNQGFTGMVLNPENPGYGQMNEEEYSAQTLWEQDAMKLSSYLIFWIPRSKEHPGLTTNIELGEWLDHPRCFIGWPPGSIENKYILERCRQAGKKVYSSMEELVSDIMISEARAWKIFFTSDTHFGIERTLKSAIRPFMNTREMDLMLSSNWNKSVRSKDVIFHLGDFGDWRALQNLNFSKMYFVQGNHDIEWRDPRLIRLEGGHKVKLNGRFYRLVHEPLHGADFPGSNEDFYLYGHIHRMGLVKENGINVGTDCHWYYPASLDEIEYIRNGIEQGYLDGDVFTRRVVP